MQAGGEHDDDFAIGQAAMDHGEQHVIALALQFIGKVAAAVPGDGTLAKRLELSDPALHALLLRKAGGTLARRIAQRIVSVDEFERRADFQFHRAGCEPLATQIAQGEISPDARDGTGRSRGIVSVLSSISAQ